MDSTGNQRSERGTHREYAYREELAERIARAVPEDGAVEPLKGLLLNRFSTPTEPLHGVSKPSLCVIAQGSKEVLLGTAATAMTRPITCSPPWSCPSWARLSRRRWNGRI